MKAFKSGTHVTTNNGIDVIVTTIKCVEENWIVYDVQSEKRTLVHSSELPDPETWPNENEVIDLTQFYKYSWEYDRRFRERKVWGRLSHSGDMYIVYNPGSKHALHKDEIGVTVGKFFDVYFSEPDMFHAKELILKAMTDRLAGLEG